MRKDRKLILKNYIINKRSEGSYFYFNMKYIVYILVVYDACTFKNNLVNRISLFSCFQLINENKNMRKILTDDALKYGEL